MFGQGSGETCKAVVLMSSQRYAAKLLAVNMHNVAPIIFDIHQRYSIGTLSVKRASLHQEICLAILPVDLVAVTTYSLSFEWIARAWTAC